MSKQSGWMSAAELMAQLQADPEHQRREAERLRADEAHAARIHALLGPVVQALAGAGFSVHRLDDLAATYAPLPAEAVAILLAWLPRIDDEVAREVIVRQLAATRVPFDDRPLVDVFQGTRSESLRWAVANTLAEATPRNVDGWLLEAAADPASGKAREMLAIAVAQHAAPERANPLLLRLLREFPGHAARGLAISGTPAEIPALNDAREGARGWQRKEIDKAIRAISRRSTPQP